MQIIDTHAHLNLKEFAADYQEVIANSLQKEVFMINVGIDYVSSKRAVEIASQYPSGVYAAIGLHPENISALKKDPALDQDGKEPDFNEDLYFQLARSSKKVVAIGEIGLDYLRLPKNEIQNSQIKEKQIKIFIQQLALAKKLNLPVIIHSRMAHHDLIKTLRQFAGDRGKINGVIHCFTGTETDARQYYDLGLYFGLNGIIFKQNLDNAIAQIPLDRILLETDCPYLSPFKEVKRNEPCAIETIAQRIAQIRNDTPETILESAAANSQALFNI